MDLSGTQVQPTTNYLVPSSGSTHCVPVVATFSNVPNVLDWRQFSESSFPFMPQGVFIDNTQNAVPVTITIEPIGWNVVCPANGQLMTPFPAPAAQTAQVTSPGATGPSSLFFVDFPVLPYQTGGATGGTAVTITGQPITTLPANVASAVALSSQPVSNVELTTDPGEWSVTSAPAAATAVSAVKAAGAAGVRHVLKSIQISLNAVAAQAAPIVVQVLDGLAVIWTDKLMAPATFSDRISVTGLNIVGSVATSMTLQTTTAPAATNFVTGSMTGYDAT